jgi:hypothetical protein
MEAEPAERRRREKRRPEEGLHVPEGAAGDERSFSARFCRTWAETRARATHTPVSGDPRRLRASASSPPRARPRTADHVLRKDYVPVEAGLAELGL